MHCVTITDAHLDTLQWVSLIYYLRESNRENGLVADKTKPGSPSSIAAVGLSLATAPVVVERELMSREEAAAIVLKKLRFFRDSPQGPESDATGYKGFYYHFLDMKTGRRVWDCELSTIDTAFLIAGILTAATYFDRDDPVESDLRQIADGLYRRVDWEWAANGEASITHGWRPETGFIPYRYQGYDEGLLLYILALGSPTHPLGAEGYQAWCSTFQWKSIHDIEYLYSGPLFTHQLSHLFLDLRGIQDRFMREHEIDYFENSRRATYVHRDYAIRNPHEFENYSEVCWGFTASDGPGWMTRSIKGVDRTFYDYIARGAPFGPDDGTVSPWVVVASIPFAPEIVLPTIQHFNSLDLGMTDSYGFKTSFNPTYSVEGSNCGWVSPWYFGIDQGPLVLMIENYRTGLLWSITKNCPYLVNGLRKAGFQGGWL
ncbi:glucoamylase family protein [Tundrisphaera lichenicola]|uniref:glucoamylase family protein n=1 Tax=Tundrisphaera lichenicola TaxID=2029860 RepID=UPI003EBC143C